MQPMPDWTSTFFDGFIVAAQRKINSAEQTQTEADFLEQALAAAPGARILDVPCGNGRLSIALAGRGYQLTGVDRTAPLLEDGRKDARERGLPASFEQRDMRDLPWPASFDAAFCFGNSFAYFDEDGDCAFLRAVQSSLRNGGRFVLETHFVMESLFSQPFYRRWYPINDFYFLHETHFDPPTSRLTSSYILVRNGQIERKQAVYRVYTYREVLRLFEEAGFVVSETFGSLKREPFQLGSSGLWIVGRKS
jgi:SAM-dependent methyltransferase